MARRMLSARKPLRTEEDEEEERSEGIGLSLLAFRENTKEQVS